MAFTPLEVPQWERFVFGLADINDDGFVDIIGATFDSMQVLSGSGGGQFERRPSTYSFPRDFPLFGESGIGFFFGDVFDIDRDGRLDVLTMAPDAFVSHFNLGGGDFDRSIHHLSVLDSRTDSALDFAYGDVDGDGCRDLFFGVCRVARADLIRVYRSGCDGTFSLHTDLELNGNLVRLRAGDLNADGRDDAVIWMRTGDGSRIFSALANTEGRLGTPALLFDNRLPSDPGSFAVADFDNDDITDIVVAESVSDPDLVFLPGVGDGTFLGHVGSSTVLCGEPSIFREECAIFSLNLNGDEYPDLVAQIIGRRDRIELLLNRGRGVFSSVAVIEAETLVPLGSGESAQFSLYADSFADTADVNGDGRLDLWVRVRVESLGGEVDVRTVLLLQR